MPLRLRATLAAALVATLAGCSAAPGPDPDGTEGVAAVRLDATLDSPIDITLRWKGEEPEAAGRTVEFATEKKGPYTVLEFVPPGRTTYRHPDLMPLTPFYYRLRAFYGPASRPVDVSLPPGEPTPQEQKDDHKWATPRTVAAGPAVGTAPLSATGTNAAAAPTDFTPTVMHATGIQFTWTDHADGEDGYLLEVRTAGDGTYRPVALLDPDINSFGLITLPEEKKASYRIRAFVYGGQSNVVHLKTGPDPTTG